MAPDDWHVPDLPGHGTTPAPRHGAYDPMGPVTLARWTLGRRGLVVGVGQNAHGALILAAGRRVRRRRHRRRPLGPVADPDDAIADMYASLRAILADDAADRPRRRRPASTRGRGTATASACRRLRPALLGRDRLPGPGHRDARVTHPADERAERVGLVRRPDDPRRAATTSPAAVVTADDRRAGTVRGT